MRKTRHPYATMIRCAVLALATAIPGFAWSMPQTQATQAGNRTTDRPSTGDPRPRSARPLGARLGQRLGAQTSRSPAPIGHPRRRTAQGDRSPLPTQVLVDADVAQPQ